MTEPVRRDSPIEDYLDELMTRLRVPPREIRRMLAEAEDHLLEAADRAQGLGMTRVEAEREAVRAFGSATDVATAVRVGRRPSLAAVVGNSGWALLTLLAVGLVAVGVSGVVAALFNLTGPHFVGALPDDYPVATCHRYLTLHSGAGTCARAAMLENSQDAVILRLLAGLVGVGLLAAAVWCRRYLHADAKGQRVRDGAIGVLACLCFAAAAAALVGAAVDVGVQHGSGGVGWYLSGAIASVAGAVAAALYAWHRLRSVRPWSVLLTPATD